MSRLIEILDSRGSAQYTDTDLPLAIGSGSGAHILLQEGNDVEAYIGLSQGYLFIQPAEESAIYHNDNHIDVSTWIKSGDTSMIGSSLLQYIVSGDLVEIRVSRVDDHKVLLPPGMPHPESVSANDTLPRISKDIREGSSKIRKLSMLAGGIFFLLIVAAAFVLTALSLEIEVSPTPDTISVSGFPPVFKFGSHFLGLRGNYTVKATKAGYKQLKKPVTIAKNARNHFSFVLAKLPGRVDFITTPVDGAQVFIDGSSIGMTPLNDVQLAAGQHLIRIARERYLAREQMIDITGLDTKQTLRIYPCTCLGRGDPEH